MAALIFLMLLSLVTALVIVSASLVAVCLHYRQNNNPYDEEDA